MTFVYPGFLYFLLLAFIPVIIHLFNLRKSRKLVFSNIKFLLEVKSASKSKTKVQRWLILLMRVLFVVFLVFAFAQPLSIDTENITSKNDKQYIYIDNSLSMQLNEGKGEKLDLVKNVLLDGLDKTSQYVMLTNAGFSKNGKGKDIQEYVSSIAYTNQQKHYSQVINKLSDIPIEVPVYLFSDFQYNFLDPRQKLDSVAQKVVLIPVNMGDVKNVYVDSLWLNSPFPQKNQLVQLSVKVKNTGQSEAKSVAIKLNIEGIEEGATVIDLRKSEEQVIVFNLSLGTKNFTTGKVILEDGGALFDNEFYFSINTSNQINVLVLSQKKEPYLPLVFEDSLFHKTVVEPQASQTIDFNAYDLVVLEELPSIPDYLIEHLMTSDATIMLFPSHNITDEGSYRSLLTTVGVKQLTIHKSDSLVLDEGYLLATPEYNNPFFKGLFEKEEENLSMPRPATTLNWSNTGDVLLQNKRDEPVLAYFNNKHKAYIWSTPISGSNVDLAMHSIFLPVLYQASINSVDVEQKLYHRYSDIVLAYKGDFTSYRDRLKLFYEDKELANAKVNPVKMLFELPSQNLPSGMFNVGTKDSTFYQVAINYSKEESIMDFCTDNELQELFEGQANVTVKPLQSFEDEIRSTIGNEDKSFPYWKICLILSLMFLLGETLLIRYNK